MPDEVVEQGLGLSDPSELGQRQDARDLTGAVDADDCPALQTLSGQELDLAEATLVTLDAYQLQEGVHLRGHLIGAGDRVAQSRHQFFGGVELAEEAMNVDE